MRQQDLADVLGLNQSHVARTLIKLRERGVLTLSQDRLVILDGEQLKRLADR